jgi:hypothetical protein
MKYSSPKYSSPVEGFRLAYDRVGSVPILLKLLSEFAIFIPHEIDALNGVLVV